jgi:hypothetical protein
LETVEHDTPDHSKTDMSPLRRESRRLNYCSTKQDCRFPQVGGLHHRYERQERSGATECRSLHVNHSSIQADLDDLKERIGRLFRRPESRRQIGPYVDGLIGEVDKNGWQLTEYAGDPAPCECKRGWVGLFGIRNERGISAETT